MRMLKKAKPPVIGIMISRFETGRFVPPIQIMDPRKQHDKSGDLSTIRTPAWPLLPELWLPKAPVKAPSLDRPRQFIRAVKDDPNTRD